MNDKIKKENRPIVSSKEISSRILDENNVFLVGFKIPGRGEIKIKISFEKE